MVTPDNCAPCEARLEIGGVRSSEPGVMSAWCVRGRVAGVGQEGESSVCEGGAAGGEASAVLLVSIGNEVGWSAAVGVVGVVGTVVVAVWFVLGLDFDFDFDFDLDLDLDLDLAPAGGITLSSDVAVGREASGGVCC